MKKLIAGIVLLCAVIALKKGSRLETQVSQTLDVPHRESAAPLTISNAKTEADEVVVGPEITLEGPLTRKLVSFYLGRQKALLTHAEKKRLQDMMADKAVIAQALARLSAVPATFAQTDEFDRMNAVYFLTQAMEWTNNPARRFLLDEVKKTILQYRTPAHLPLRLQKSIAADRVELFKALIENAPEMAAEVEALAAKSDAAKIIKFTKGFYS